MKKKQLWFLVLFSLVFVLAGCKKDHSTEGGMVQSGKTSQNSNSKQDGTGTGTPLFEMFTDKGMLDFVENFDPENVDYAVYYHDEEAEIEVEDKETIKELFDGLKEIRVVKKYKKDTFVTDSAESVSFIMKDGSSYGVGFDFGNVYINGDLYECTNKGALQDVIFHLKNRDPDYLFDLYEDEATQDFIGNFDTRNVESVTIQYDEEVTVEVKKKTDIGKLFDYLSYSRIYGKERNGSSPEDTRIQIRFHLNDGKSVEFLLERGRTIKADVEGTLYICEYNYSLADLLDSWLKENGSAENEKKTEDSNKEFAFPEEFDLKHVESLLYSGEEKTVEVGKEDVEGIAEIVYDTFRGVKVLGKYSDEKSGVNFPETMQFFMDDDTNVTIRYKETDSYLRIALDGIMHICQPTNGALQDVVRMMERVQK